MEEQTIIFVWHSGSPGKRKDLLGKFPEQGRLGGVGEHQHHVDVARTQLDQVAGVGDVRQLRHLHKVLPRRTAAEEWSDKVNRSEGTAGATRQELQPLTWHHRKWSLQDATLKCSLGSRGQPQLVAALLVLASWVCSQLAH